MRRAVCLVVAAAALLAPVRAQEEPPVPLAQRRKEVLEGTHVFRRILADNDLVPLESFEALAERPGKTILIVHGDLNVLDRVPGGLAQFVADGGAVLLASDRAVSSRTARAALIATAGVTINSETLVNPNREACYKGIEYCPVAIAWQPPDAHLFRTDAGNTILLATNTPSMLIPRYIRLDPPTLRLPIMATLPFGSMIETPEGPRPAMWDRAVGGDVQPDAGNIRNYPAFLVGGDVGPGRVLVLADHSVFINEMMMPTDNQNVEFTANAVNWLRGDDRARDRALFVENGVIETKFDLPVRSGTIPPREALELLFAQRNPLLVALGDQLTQWENDGTYDKKVIDWLSRQGLPPGRLAQWGVLIGSGLLMLLMLVRLAFRYRFGHDTTAPGLVTAVSGNFPARPLEQQRTVAMLREDNVHEAARALVRDWFTRQGLDVPPGSEAPAFRVAGGWSERRRRGKRLKALWELASGRATRRVGAPSIWALQRELEELAEARRRGGWAPAGPGNDER